MKPVVQLIALSALLWQGTCEAADDAFYAQVVACIGTNNTPGRHLSAAGLVDTNNMAPSLTGAAMERIRLRPQAGVAGIRPGMKMGQVVEAWGKPQWMWM